MSRALVGFVKIARRIGAAFGIEGDFPGGVAPLTQPVALAEDLTDTRYLFLKGGGGSFEASQSTGQNGAAYPSIYLMARAGGTPQGVTRLIRVKSLSLWDDTGGGVGTVIGWTLLDRNQAVPAMASTLVVEPTRRDARLAFDSSLYIAAQGFTGANGANYGSTRRWARVAVAPGQPNGQSEGALRFDPEITLRPGDILWIAGSHLSHSYGWSVSWEEIPCSDQELAADSGP